MDPIRICFVCLGNICRSPTAEACFLHLIERDDDASRFVVDSAGTGSWHVGEPAHADTRSAARKRGIEVKSIARQFVASDFGRFDYVLAMDKSNLASLRGMARNDSDHAKIHLFRDFDPGSPKGAEVPDPYYEGGFDRVLDICEAAARGLYRHLRESHGRS